MSRRGCVVAVLLVMGCAVGCGDPGPKLLRSTGTVTYQGEPVAGALVTFTFNSGEAASGNTDAEGKFAIDSSAGLAKVAVSKVSGSNVPQDVGSMNPTEAMAKMHAGSQKKEDMASNKDELPEKYSRPNTSGFEADVKEGGTNDFTFALTD